MKVILEILGEGGSISLLRGAEGFLFTTEELFFEDEFTVSDLKSHSDFYNSFQKAMIEMLKKYPVFLLHPEQVNPQYKETIKIYFENYLLYNDTEENWSLGEWKSKLNIK